MSKHRATPEARMGLFSAVLYGALPSLANQQNNPSLPNPCPTQALSSRTQPARSWHDRHHRGGDGIH
jgi:hypothetical protein